MREQEHYPQPLRLPQGWPGCAFIFLWGLAFGSAVLMAPLGIGIVFGLIGWGAAAAVLYSGWRMLAPARRGIRATPEGLTEIFWARAPRHIGWDQVRAVVPRPGGARLETDLGELELDSKLPGWPRLVRRVERALGAAGTPREPTGELVPAEEILTWLGSPPGGELRCAPSRSVVGGLVLLPLWLVVTIGLVLFYSMFIGGALRGEGGLRIGALLFTLAHAAIFFGVFSGGLGAVVYRQLFAASRRHVVADEHGLRVMDRQGRRFVDWSELRDCAMRDGQWLVSTDEDEFGFEPGDRLAPKLLQAIRAAIAARQAGRGLPTSGEATDAALSLARETGEPEAVERGLSVADRPGDPT